jgi:hypothetical protein
MFTCAMYPTMLHFRRENIKAKAEQQIKRLGYTLVLCGAEIAGSKKAGSLGMASWWEQKKEKKRNLG